MSAFRSTHSHLRNATLNLNIEPSRFNVASQALKVLSNAKPERRRFSPSVSNRLLAGVLRNSFLFELNMIRGGIMFSFFKNLEIYK